jgi:DNA-directed RNA polymerase specialized sigma24 family protein
MKSEQDLLWHCQTTLLRCAASARRRDPNCALTPISIVQEAWLRLQGRPVLAGVSQSHFRALAARTMVYVVLDAARRRLRAKRPRFVTELEDDSGAQRYSVEAMIAIGEALERLERRDPRGHAIAIQTWFGGCTAPEVADNLGLTEAIVKHELRLLDSWRNSLLD